MSLEIKNRFKSDMFLFIVVLILCVSNFIKFNYKMPKLLPSGAEERIHTLSSIGMSSRDIVQTLKEQNMDVSQRSVSNVVNNKGIMREAMVNGQQKPKYRRPVKIRTPENIRKVHKMASQCNPPSLKYMARKIGTSDTTNGKMIHDDNQMVTRIKRKVHKLNDKQKQNRKTNARKLHEHYLAGNKSEYAVTIDEAWLYQHYCDQQTKKCYVKKGDNVPENWVREHDESFPKGFMVVGGITGRGPLPLMRIPKNTKISSETFLKYVLRPLMKKHLPKIYPNEMDKVFIIMTKPHPIQHRRLKNILQKNV